MVSHAFAAVLASGRTQFNRSVTEARRRHPSFDSAAFADFLRTGVDGVVAAVAAVRPDRVASVVLAAYDIALELVGQALAGPGARGTLPNRVWRELAPACAALVAERPAEVLGSLSNAAVHLEAMASVRSAQWLAEMIRVGPLVTSLAQLQALGQVLAWRAGMAHFRDGAIAAAELLQETLVRSAFGLDDNDTWVALRARLLADPWCVAGAGQSAGMEIGSFTGFGGAFSAPPEVRACGQGFFVKSAQRYSLLIADAYGALLHGATEEEFQHAPADSAAALALDGAVLLIGGRKIALDLPPDGIALACNAHTVAVTSPYTHAIRLLPLR